MSNHLPPEILKHLDDYQTAMLDMANDMRKLQNNFEIHMENQIKYAGEVVKMGKQLDGLCVKFNELKLEVTPIIVNFNGLKWSGWLVIKVIAFLASTIGLFLMIKALFKK